MPKVLEPCFDWTAQFNQQRIALAVARLARLHLNPAFGNTIFLNRRAGCALKTNADAARQKVAIEMRAHRVNR